MLALAPVRAGGPPPWPQVARSAGPAASQPATSTARPLRTPAEIREALQSGVPDQQLLALTALGATGGWLEPEWLPAIEALLEQSAPEMRTRALEAIARIRPPAAEAILVRMIDDRSQPSSVRRAAARGLACQGSRLAAETLVRHCDSSDVGVAQTALDSLAQLVGEQWADAAGAQAWWRTQGGMTELGWAGARIARWQERALARELELQELRARVTADRRAEWLRAAEPRRAELLIQFLSDPSPAVRLLGLELAQSRREPDAALSAAAINAVRGLIDDRDQAVQLAAIRGLAGLRNPADAALLQARLTAEQPAPVQAALVNALGYLGGSEVLPTLLAQTKSSAREVQIEAANAIGRLAERDVLSESEREDAGAALTALWDGTTRDPALRERAIWALGSLTLPAARERLIGALAPTESASVRQSATAGLAALGDEISCAALRAACTDADATVRRAALENYSRTPATVEQRECLWRACWAASEPDAVARQIAWSALVRGLSKPSWEDVRPLMLKLPPDDPATIPRCDELARLALSAFDSAASDRLPRFDVRRVQADICRAAGDRGALRRALVHAITELDVVAPNSGVEVGVELLSLSLFDEGYDEEIHAALRTVWPTPAMFWGQLRAAIEAHQAIDAIAARRAAVSVSSFIDGTTPIDCAAWLQTAATDAPSPVPAPANPASQPVTQRTDADSRS